MRQAIKSALAASGWYRTALELRERLAGGEMWDTFAADFETSADAWRALRPPTPPPADAPVVWLNAGVPLLGLIKHEMLFALMYQAAGYRPALVMDTPEVSKWRRTFHALLGERDEIDLIRAEATTPPPTPAPAFDRFRQPGVTFKDLLALTYHRVDIGRIVLSNVKDRHKIDDFSLSDADLREEIYANLLAVQHRIHAFEDLIDAHRPAALWVVEKIFSYNAELVAVCLAKGVPVVQFVSRLNKGHFTLKRYTYENRYAYPLSFDAEMWRYVRDEMPWSPEQSATIAADIRAAYAPESDDKARFESIQTEQKSRTEMITAFGLDANKPTAVVFSHVLWDATFFYGQTHFGDYESWLMETIRLAIANPSLNWIIKLHPHLTWKLRAMGYTGEPRETIALRGNFGELPDHVYIAGPDVGVKSLSFFDLADYGVTVRGTVGIEMSVLGVPVITGGTGRYANLGFTIDPPDEDAYRHTLTHLTDIPPLTDEQIELARRYAHAIYNHRVWHIQTLEDVFEAGSVTDDSLPLLLTDLVPTVSSHAALLDAPDIARAIAWLRSGQPDYWE